MPQAHGAISFGFTWQCFHLARTYAKSRLTRRSDRIRCLISCLPAYKMREEHHAFLKKNIAALKQLLEAEGIPFEKNLKSGANPDDYDLVITYQSMPELTGEAICREIFSIRADIPIIMCTGYSTKLDSKTLKELGVSSFLMKPASRYELISAIRQSLESNRLRATDNYPS